MKNNLKLNLINKQIKKSLLKHNKNFYVIGISGGIDSFIALTLLINNVGIEKIKAYYLPIQNYESKNDINLIEKFLKIKINTIDLTNEYNNYCKLIPFCNNLEQSNIKPKLRSIFLASVALHYNGLVVSCLNYDEYYLGYFTKYGDSAGDIYPLINLLKTEIYNLANKFNCPKQIINKKPTAELIDNQTDESDFGFNYPELDKFLKYKKISYSSKTKIIQMHKKNQHKHNLNKYLFNKVIFMRR